MVAPYEATGQRAFQEHIVVVVIVAKLLWNDPVAVNRNFAEKKRTGRKAVWCGVAMLGLVTERGMYYR